jgi:hypothetical protein
VPCSACQYRPNNLGDASCWRGSLSECRKSLATCICVWDCTDHDCTLQASIQRRTRLEVVNSSHLLRGVSAWTSCRAPTPTTGYAGRDQLTDDRGAIFGPSSEAPVLHHAEVALGSKQLMSFVVSASSLPARHPSIRLILHLPSFPPLFSLSLHTPLERRTRPRSTIHPIRRQRRPQLPPPSLTLPSRRARRNPSTDDPSLLHPLPSRLSPRNHGHPRWTVQQGVSQALAVLRYRCHGGCALWI